MKRDLSEVGAINDDAVRRDVDSHKGRSRYHKFEEGKNYIRILPPLKGKTQPGTYYGLHREHGIRTAGAYRSVHCLHDRNQWCPICTMADYFKADGSEEAMKSARNCFSRAKYFLNAIVAKLVNGELVFDEDQGIILLQLSNALFDKCDNLRYSEWGNFTDPENGYWIYVEATGEGQARRYPNVNPSRKGMGPLPEWVDFSEAHDLTSNELVPYRKTSDMVMMMIDRYAEMVDVEKILRTDQQKWKAKKGKAQ